MGFYYEKLLILKLSETETSTFGFYRWVEGLAEAEHISLDHISIRINRTIRCNFMSYGTLSGRRSK